MAAQLEIDRERAQLDDRSCLHFQMRTALGRRGRHGQSLQIEAEGRICIGIQRPSDCCAEMTTRGLEGGPKIFFFMIEAGTSEDGDEPLADVDVDVRPVANSPVGGERELVSLRFQEEFIWSEVGGCVHLWSFEAWSNPGWGAEDDPPISDEPAAGVGPRQDTAMKAPDVSDL